MVGGLVTQGSKASRPPPHPAGYPVAQIPCEGSIDEAEDTLSYMEGPEAVAEMRDFARKCGLMEIGRFAPLLAEPDFQAGRRLASPPRQPGVFGRSPIAYSWDASVFVLTAYSLITSLDWRKWAKTAEGAGLLADPARVASADAEQLGHLLTVLIRGEQAVAGTLLDAFTKGLPAAIARRAAELSSTPKKGTQVAMAFKRSLPQSFLDDLKDGILQPLLERVQQDETLMLALREKYINIYYRGGVLFEIKAGAPSRPNSDEQPTYQAKFDENYNRNGGKLPVSIPFPISSSADAGKLAASVAELKFVMDRFLLKGGKPEREFQQLVARENNRSRISKYTDYFVIDIEIAGILPRTRFDMLAARWIEPNGRQTGRLVPVLIEMKYGIDALGGRSGLESHLAQARSVTSDKVAWHHLIKDLEEQLNQLDSLKLLNYNRGVRVKRLEIDRDKPEVVFLLANYNPASSKLKTFLDAVPENEEQRADFNLLFFTSCFAGYGMYHESMLELGEFKTEVNRLHALTRSSSGRD
jgi:hypothetical protein